MDNAGLQPSLIMIDPSSMCTYILHKNDTPVSVSSTNTSIHTLDDVEGIESVVSTIFNSLDVKKATAIIKL